MTKKQIIIKIIKDTQINFNIINTLISESIDYSKRVGYYNGYKNMNWDNKECIIYINGHDVAGIRKCNSRSWFFWTAWTNEEPNLIW